MRPVDVLNLRDFCKYYQSTYFGMRKDGVVVPYYVMGEHSSAGTALVREAGQNPRSDYTQLTWEQLQADGVFGRPTLGMTDVEKTVRYVSTAGIREQHKGLRFNNLEIVNFNSENGFDDFKGTAIYNIFNPKYSTLREAFEAIQSGDALGKALNRNFGIYVLKDAPHILLAYKRWTIGRVVDPEWVQLFKDYSQYEDLITTKFKAIEVSYV